MGESLAIRSNQWEVISIGWKELGDFSSLSESELREERARQDTGAGSDLGHALSGMWKNHPEQARQHLAIPQKMLAEVLFARTASTANACCHSR